MAPRSGLAVGDKAGDKSDSKTEDQVSGRDALGNEPDDELEADAVTRIAPNLEDDDDEREEPRGKGPAKPPVFTDPRDAIAKAIAARKSGEVAIVSDGDADELEDGDQSDEGDAADGEVEIIGRDGKKRETAAKPAPTEKKTDPAPARTVAEVPDDHIVRMTVDGATVEMTYGELRNNAQMLVASEKRLREANGLLDRARQTTRDSAPTRTAPTDRDQDPPAPRQEARTTPIKVDPSKVKSLVSKIQLGDDDEAAAALAEAISIGVQEGNAQRGQTSTAAVDVSSAVDQRLVERDAESEVNDALRTVAEQHADVIGNRVLYPGAMVAAHESAVEKLRAIGVPEEDLRLPAVEIFKGYAQLRQDPRYRAKLAPMTDVFVGAAETVRKEAGLPAREEADDQPRRDEPRLRRADQQPTRVVRAADSDRSGRKGRVVQQPRSASMRSDFSGTGAPPAKTAPSDTIAAMAKSRGQYAGAN